MSEAERNDTAQRAADRLYAGVAGPLWRVTVGGWPTVVLPADDRDLACGRYDQVVGITGSSVPHVAELVEDYPHPLPAETPIIELTRAELAKIGPAHPAAPFLRLAPECGLRELG